MLRQAVVVSLDKAMTNTEWCPQFHVLQSPWDYVNWTDYILFCFSVWSHVTTFGSRQLSLSWAPVSSHDVFGTRCPGGKLCNDSTHATGVAGLEEKGPIWRPDLQCLSS